MRIIAAVLALAAAWLSAGAAAACSCQCSQSAEAFLESVPVLFRGKVVKTTEAKDQRGYTFQVTAKIKGDIPSRVTVWTNASSAACGAQYPTGTESVVAASGQGATLHTNLCTQYCFGRNADEINRILARCKPRAPCPPGR